MPKRNFLIGALVALAAIGGATAFAVSGGNSDPVPAGQSPRTVVGTQLASSPAATPTTTPPAAFPKEAAARLAVLRRGAESQDAFPQSGGGLLRDRGANLALARRVIDGASPYWLIPEPGGNVCFVDAAGGGSCQSAADLAQNGTIATAECGPGVPEGSCCSAASFRTAWRA